MNEKRERKVEDVNMRQWQQQKNTQATKKTKGDDDKRTCECDKENTRDNKWRPLLEALKASTGEPKQYFSSINNDMSFSFISFLSFSLTLCFKKIHDEVKKHIST